MSEETTLLAYSSFLGEVIHIRRPGWYRDALCQEYPDVNFFPTQGEPCAPAMAVCRRCLVRDECLAHALSRHEEGIWGGHGVHARRMMRRRARIAGQTEEIRA